LDGYLADTSYLGATAGRYASRIGGGRFRMDGSLYQLTLNEGNQTHLHGGTQGFSYRPWQILSKDGDSVTLSLISPDGDQGYPGTVEAPLYVSTSSRPSPVSMGGLIQDMMGFAWSRNGFRTAQTIRGSVRRCYDQEKRTARLRSIDSC